MKYADGTPRQETEGLFQLPVLVMVHTEAKPQQQGLEAAGPSTSKDVSRKKGLRACMLSCLAQLIVFIIQNPVPRERCHPQLPGSSHIN